MSRGLIINPSTGRAANDVVDLTERGAITLSNFHMLAQMFNWGIRCNQCGQMVQGNNQTTNAKYLVVQCGCREYRAEITERIRRNV